MTASATDASINALLGKARQALQRSGHAASEAEITVAAALGISRGDLELARLLNKTLTPEQWQRVEQFVLGRSRRIPLQYLTGTAPFYGHEFAVGPGVFIPRPETELLVEFAIDAADQLPPAVTVFDLGSGSGAIAASVAAALPDARVVAIEGSPHAWPWLRRNLAAIAPEVTARFGDWHALLAAQPPESVDLLLSNPPYVPAAEIPADPEVRLFDPGMALYSGSDGLDDIRRIALEAARLLRPDGFVAVEHTELQGDAVRSIYADAGLLDATTRSDLTGRDRMTYARR